MDCELHINANDDGFYGWLIDCTLTIIRSLANACTNWNQGIRLSVTVNNVDVTATLVGNINITHNKNMASIFSFTLGDSTYSPHTNSDIGLSKEVVITAYIDGFSKKLITGIIDDINMDYTPEVSINIRGMDYGKKLLDKRTTIVSVQDLANSSTRHDIIKYLAEQAGVTSVDIPEMDDVDIDNSFSDQTVWDMIQKEAIINLYWVRFNEEGVMELKLDEIKTNTTTYPTADWTYGESRFTFLGLRQNESDIINRVIVLGTTYQRRIPVVSTYDDTLIISKSWTEGESTVWDEVRGDWHIVSDVFYNDTLREDSTIICTFSGGGNFGNVSVGTDGGIIQNHPQIWNIGNVGVRFSIRRFKTGAGDLKAGSVMITIKGVKYTTNWTVQYNQIAASVSDLASIVKYSERRPSGQESIEFPLIETRAQCEAIGKKIIRDGHRSIAQPNFEVPFNPLLFTGQTISITDKKIGFDDERWHVESVNHNIEVNPVKGRTQVGCVYYAST